MFDPQANGELPKAIKLSDSNGQTPPLDLIASLEAEVYPHLDAKTIYSHESHQWREELADKIKGACPWHKSKSGTAFYVNTKSLLWYCPGCGVGGSPIQYRWKLRGGGGSPRGDDFISVVKELFDLAGVPFPDFVLSPEVQRRGQRRETRRAILEVVEAYCHTRLLLPCGNAARDYLLTRGFDENSIRDLRLGLYPSCAELKRVLQDNGFTAEDVRNSGVIFKRMEQYIIFPWRDDRGAPLTLYGTWSARTPPDGTPKKMALPNPIDGGKVAEKTKRSPLYLDRALRSGCTHVCVLEGVTDAALSQVHGDWEATACVAAELSHEQVETLRRRDIRSVTICLDPDSAGDAGIASCIRNLRAAAISPYVAPRLPDGQDPDDFILANGIDAWKAHVKKAVHAFRWQARQILVGHKLPPETDADADAIVRESVAYAAKQPAAADEEMLRHYWPEIASAVTSSVEAFQARVQAARSVTSNGTAARGTSQAQRSELNIPDPVSWPDPPNSAAYYGLAGGIVAKIEPQTEADPVAILVQVLVMFGNAIGRSAYWQVEEDKHFGNEFVCLVGETAKGRKGTSKGRALKVFEAMSDDWRQSRIASGLSSGEGLIWAVRDEIWQRQPVKKGGRIIDHQQVMTDQGVKDKRLLIIESEFVQALRAAGREGNTLSARIREAWDTGNLIALTKNNQARATNAHISIIGHITRAELCKSLADIETTNGFANRFLWLAVRRSKLLPLGGQPVDLGTDAHKMALAIEQAQAAGEIGLDAAATRLWVEDIYPRLSAPAAGVVGAVTNRGESHVRRLAMLYALLDFSPDVRPAHLLAAVALWEYCLASVRWTFGESTGDRVADELLATLSVAGDKGMSQTEIRDYFQRHQSVERIGQALQLLAEAKLAWREKTATGGKPATRWYYGRRRDQSDQSDQSPESAEKTEFSAE